MEVGLISFLDHHSLHHGKSGIAVGQDNSDFFMEESFKGMPWEVGEHSLTGSHSEIWLD
jgi:hypothetical protein